MIVSEKNKLFAQEQGQHEQGPPKIKFQKNLMSVFLNQLTLLGGRRNSGPVLGSKMSFLGSVYYLFDLLNKRPLQMYSLLLLKYNNDNC